MGYENELNILFGETTDAKNELEKLKETVDEENTPPIMKEPFANEQQEQISDNGLQEHIAVVEAVETISEKEHLEEIEVVEDDSISSHNSNRLVEEMPISNKNISNPDDFHENDKVEEISSHSFVDESLN